MRILRAFTLSLAIVFMTPAFVAAGESERPDHFEGLPADTVAQAMDNLATYNRKLAQLLAQSDVSDSELGEIHQITYTLENALAKLNSEISQLEAVLETVHEASEELERDTVKNAGNAYLAIARQITEQGQ